MSEQPASILQAFLNWASHDPQRPCLRFGASRLSYGALGQAAAEVAGGLVAWGLRRGERVALFLENSPRFLTCYLGVHLAGGTVVLVNTQYRQVELRHILSDSQARVCITDSARRAELARVQPDLPALELVIVADAAPDAGSGARSVGAASASVSPTTVVDESGTAVAAEPTTTVPDVLSYAGLLDLGPALSDPVLPEPDAVAIIAYTSGTTGRAKGAMLSHGNLAANSAAVTSAWGWTDADRLLLTLPLFHIHGLGVGTHGSWFVGASIDLRPRFDAAEVFAALLDDPPTMFFGVPTMYSRLIDEAQRRAIRPQPIRLYVSGSAPLSAQTFAEFEQLFGQQILERYGMTETIMNLTNPLHGERRPGTVGLPFPGQEARIVAVRSREVLGAGEVGEIQVRGPHVCQGYWRRPEATAEVFGADGWFSTGDLGQRSADGYYTIVGRARELIISGGYNIYPREIEEVLATCPGVAEVAVFAIPDADLGEQVVAAIVAEPASPLSAEAVVAFCRDQLAAYKKPRRVVFVDTLPRNAMGKVLKHVLAEQAAQE